MLLKFQQLYRLLLACLQSCELHTIDRWQSVNTTNLQNRACICNLHIHYQVFLLGHHHFLYWLTVVFVACQMTFCKPKMKQAPTGYRLCHLLPPYHCELLKSAICIHSIKVVYSIVSESVHLVSVVPVYFVIHFFEKRLSYYLFLWVVRIFFVKSIGYANVVASVSYCYALAASYLPLVFGNLINMLPLAIFYNGIFKKNPCFIHVIII